MINLGVIRKFRIMMNVRGFPCLLAGILPLLVFPPVAGERGDDYGRLRADMVKYQLKERDISDPHVLEVMGRVPRHLFVGKKYRALAYRDFPLPIAEGQTISQPYIVALMTQCLDVKAGDKILEIGTGSGYQAAVLAHFSDQVYSVEIRKPLAEKAAATLENLGYNVRVKYGDGYYGWEEYAPFDKIIVTCAANHVPPPLLKQLKEGGFLIIPLGSTLLYQTLTLITKTGEGPQVEHILGVRFVPMTGEAEKK
jgi:protein-L-isoaspartate(D-aspartate) O-methyltransferase